MSISLKSNQLSSYPVSLQPFWTIGLLLHIKLASCLNFLFIFYRVCRQWKKCSRCPLLWRKVDVTVNQGSGSQTEMAVDFSKTLPSSVTHLKLKFWHKFHSSDKRLNFVALCEILKIKCPHLETLILQHTVLSVNFQSVVAVCAYFLAKLKVLMFRSSKFANQFDGTLKKYCGISNIEI